MKRSASCGVVVLEMEDLVVLLAEFHRERVLRLEERAVDGINEHHDHTAARGSFRALLALDRWHVKVARGATTLVRGAPRRVPAQKAFVVLAAEAAPAHFRPHVALGVAAEADLGRARCRAVLLHQRDGCTRWRGGRAAHPRHSCNVCIVDLVAFAACERVHRRILPTREWAIRVDVDQLAHGAVRRPGTARRCRPGHRGWREQEDAATAQHLRRERVL